MRFKRFLLPPFLLLSSFSIAQNDTVFYDTGDKYIGDQVNGLCEGTGTMIWAEGDVYSGQWKQNVIHGKRPHGMG
ncbi:MAG: hypothetical protein IPG07_10565 [Crocinitomicaceae bacterium]|nr:hypothetical protein [Crocinitomicaceae bacterium]